MKKCTNQKKIHQKLPNVKINHINHPDNSTCFDINYDQLLIAKRGIIEIKDRKNQEKKYLDIFKEGKKIKNNLKKK